MLLVLKRLGDAYGSGYFFTDNPANDSGLLVIIVSRYELLFTPRNRSVSLHIDNIQRR